MLKLIQFKIMTKLKFKGRKEGERKQILNCGREVKLNKKDYLDKNILTEKADIIKKKEPKPVSCVKCR